MTDNDLIRRGDAIELAREQGLLSIEELRAIRAVQVGIKPLEWFEAELPSRGGGKYTADGYTIRKIEGLWLLDFCGDVKTKWRWVDIDAAKAAAQADYEARIRSALTVQPSPDVGVKPEWLTNCAVCGRVVDTREAEAYAWKLEEELRDTQDRANAFATKEYYTEMRAERAEAKLAKALEALLWCSGSADFNEGGVARKGWLKVCAPLLKGESHE